MFEAILLAVAMLTAPVKPIPADFGTCLYEAPRAMIAEYPADPDLILEVIDQQWPRRSSWPPRSKDADLRVIVSMLVAKAPGVRVPIPILVGIGVRESNWTMDAESPSGAFCGPFQRAARYSLSRTTGLVVPESIACRDSPECVRACYLLRVVPELAAIELLHYVHYTVQRTNANPRTMVGLATVAARYQTGAFATGPVHTPYSNAVLQHAQQFETAYVNAWRARMNRLALGQECRMFTPAAARESSNLFAGCSPAFSTHQSVASLPPRALIAP